VTVLVADVFGELNAAVTPAGRPVAASVTLPEKLFAGFTVSVAMPVPPGLMESAAALLESVKDGPPEVPVRS
jgi:hypothetical protein